MARAAASNAPITRAQEPPPEPREGAAREPAPESRTETKPAKASPRNERPSGARRGSGGGRAASGTARGGASAEGKLTRLSVDVPRSQHVFLRVEAAQAGTTGMAVVRALISEMQDDPELARRIRKRIASEE